MMSGLVEQPYSPVVIHGYRDRCVAFQIHSSVPQLLSTLKTTAPIKKIQASLPLVLCPASCLPGSSRLTAETVAAATPPPPLSLLHWFTHSTLTHSPSLSFFPHSSLLSSCLSSHWLIQLPISQTHTTDVVLCGTPASVNIRALQ